MRVGVFVLLCVAAAGCQEEEEEGTTPAVTSFSCDGRVPGYYADVETGCRTYHHCIGSSRFTYECPNNTLFEQRVFICNHWYLVNCDRSPEFYASNLLIGQRDKPFVEDAATAADPEVHTQTGTTVYTTARYDTTNTRDYDDPFNATTTTATPAADVEDSVPRVEEEPQSLDVILTPAPSVTKEVPRTGKSSSEDDAFIRLSFTDPRRLFYIPEDSNSLETASSPSFREFLIRKHTNEVEVMHFKDGSGRDGGDVVCPKYCNPRFVKPGTCHPCIMIK